MDFNKLRTFVKVVESGSISQAATLICRTQQAISLQIKLLEEELDVPLFQRVGPKLHLTCEGELLYKKSKAHLSQLEGLWRDMKREAKADQCIVAVGASPEQGVRYLPALITRLRQRCSGANVKLVLAADDELEDRLIENRIDFGFLRCLRNNDKLLCSHTVLIRELIPVVSCGYLQRAKPIGSLSDTLDHDLIEYSTAYSPYLSWIRENARELMPLAVQKQPVVMVDNDMVQKSLVLNDGGMAFLPKELIEKELASGEIVQVLADRVKPIAWNICIAYKRKRTMNSAQEEFLRAVGVAPVWQSKESIA